MKPEPFITGVFFTLLSATGLSFTILFSKICIEEVSILTLLSCRFVLSFLFCLGILYFTKFLDSFFPIKNIRLNLLRALFVIGSQYSIVYYLEGNTLLNATVLLNTGPLFMPFIERVLLKHEIGKSTWIGLVVSFIGVVCILQPDKGIISKMSLIGLFGGFCMGVSQVIFGISQREEKSYMSVLYLFFFCALFSLIPFFFFNPVKTHLTEPISKIAIYLALLGFCSCLNQIFRATAYQYDRPSRLGSFLYFAVLLSGFMDWAVFGNIPNALTIIGAVLVVGGGILKIYVRALILKNRNR